MIPVEIRKKLNIIEGSVLDLEVEGDRIVLKKTMMLLDAFGVDKDSGDLPLRELERLRREEVEKENTA